ncbi:MAG TPA: hypothetical protein VL284_04510, partial [Thermoanaerobaculia bacterium]|nr:hypothetical protein [Thermoanaerobaculia bacterium]
MATRSRLFAICFFVVAASGFALEPPVPPLPVAHGAWRGALLSSAAPLRVAAQRERAASPADDSEETVFLPLSSGLSMISVPLRTDSQLLSDIFKNLPDGSRIWTWDTEQQQFVEGFDQQLPSGGGVMLYLPAPAVVAITGQSDAYSDFPVELANGWNLVGVPYTTPIARLALTVYVNQMQTPFNDAVGEGALSEPVMTLGSDGYENVGADDSFKPMSAYWVYSNTADLMDEQPPLLLGSLPAKFAWWVAEKAGGAAVNYGVSRLLSELTGDPDTASLNDIESQLQQVLDAQAAIGENFKEVKTQINGLSAKLDVLEQRQAIASARSVIETFYDPPDLANQSLTWFAENGKTAAGRALITDTARIQFANSILGQNKIATQFTAINNAIIGKDGIGIMDALRNQLVVTGTSGADLQKGYEAMEAYFNDLITLQNKAMTLITNAMNTLADVPGSGYTASSADAYRKGTYWSAITAETLRFRDAVDGLAAANLRISQTVNDPPVSIPAEVSDVILPRADFGIMNLLGEAPGIRLHAFVSPDMNPNNPYSLTEFRRSASPNLSTITALPSTDSGLWTTMKDPCNPACAWPLYDSWRINVINFNEVRVTSDWLMYRTILPVTMAARPYVVKLTDAWGLTEDGDTNAYPLQSFTYGRVDSNRQPSSSGTLFGSVVVAKRA